MYNSFVYFHHLFDLIFFIYIITFQIKNLSFFFIQKNKEDIYHFNYKLIDN